MKNYFAPLGQPGLRRLIAASLPADLADWLDYVAVVALLAYYWQAGPWPLALFAVALGTPYILVGPILGVFVDRMNLRTVLVISNLGRALTTFALVFAPNPTFVLILVLLRSSIDSAFTPARLSAIRALATDDLLDGANGLVQAINQFSKVVGPALGGLMLIFVAPQIIFALNAMLSLLAAALLRGIDVPPPSASEEKPRPVLLDAFTGFSEFFRNRALLYALAFMTLGFFSIFLYDTFIALLAQDFGFDTAIYGFSVAVGGAGGVIGALIAAGLNFGNWHLRVMAIGGAVSGTFTFLLGALSVFGWVVSPLLFLGAFLLIGVAMSFITVPYRSLVQREAPPGKTARVFAAGEAATTLALLTAPFAGGALAGTFGIGTPFTLGGALLVLVSISAFGVGSRKAVPQAEEE